MNVELSVNFSKLKCSIVLYIVDGITVVFCLIQCLLSGTVSKFSMF